MGNCIACAAPLVPSQHRYTARRRSFSSSGAATTWRSNTTASCNQVACEVSPELHDISCLQKQLEAFLKQPSLEAAVLTSPKDGTSNASLGYAHQDSLRQQLISLKALAAAAQEHLNAKSQTQQGGEQKGGDVVVMAQTSEEELQLKYEEVLAVNEAMRMRLTNLVTGHGHETISTEVERQAAPEDTSPVDAWQAEALCAIRDGSTSSSLKQTWGSADCRQWTGVRVQHKAVTGIALSGMKLCYLPSDIGRLTSVTVLMLSNNSLIELPSSIGALKQLVTLHLDRNELRVLPQQVTQLASLQTLWVQDNKLEELPDSIGALGALQQLLLSNNRLVTIPDSIGNLRGLKSLWLDGNLIQELPPSVNRLPNLLRLRLDPPLSATPRPALPQPPVSPDASPLQTEQLTSLAEAPRLVGPARYRRCSADARPARPAWLEGAPSPSASEDEEAGVRHSAGAFRRADI